MNIVNGLRGVKKVVASFSIAALVATSFAIGVAQAQTFPDVNPSDWYYSFVEDLVAQGVVNGSMPAYRPADKVNRAEMAKLVVEAFDIELISPTKQTFKDVETDKWYYPYIETAVAHGIVGGYKDEAGDYTGYYGPGDDVTREQAAKMIVLGAPLDINTGCGPTFDDVKLSSWSYEFVETLYVNSIVDGYDDGTFGPNKNIVRSEVAKIVSNAMDPILRPCGGFSVESATAMSDTTVEVCYTMNYDDVSALMVENYEVKDVDGNKLAVKEVEETSDSKCVVLTTEAQEASKVYNLVVTDVVSDTDMDLLNGKATFKGYTVGKVGDLTVRLDGSTPEGTNIPSNAGKVLYTVLNFSAGSDEAVRIEELTIARKGLGLPGDFDAVKLYVNGVQKGSSKSVNVSSNTANFVIKGNPIVVPAGSNVLVEVRGDMAGEENSFNALCLNASADVVAYGQNTNQKVSVSGSFAICGNQMNTTSAMVGALDYEVKSFNGDIEIGEEEVKVASLELTESANKEDVDIKRLTFTQDGTATAKDFANPVLYVAGKKLEAKASWVSDDVLTFDLSEAPVKIERGSSKLFNLHVDVVSGLDKTVLFDIEDDADIEAIGRVYGFGVGLTDKSSALSSRKIVGGDLAFSINKNYDPDEYNVSPGSKDFIFMAFNVSSGGEPIVINEMELKQTEAGTVAEDKLINVRIAEKEGDGYTFYGSFDYDGTTSAIELEKLGIDLKGGEKKELFIIGNLKNDVTAPAKIAFSIDTTKVKAKYNGESKKTAVNNITGGTLAGKTYEVADPELNVNLKGVPSDRTVVGGTQGLPIAKWSVTASGADVEVSSIMLSCSYNDNLPTGDICKDAFSNLSLYQMVDGSEKPLKLSRSLTTGNPVATVTFDGFNLLVPANKTTDILLKGDVAQSVDANDSANWSFMNSTDVTANAPDIGYIAVTKNLDTNPRNIAFGGVGTLTVNTSASTPKGNALLADSKNNKVTSLSFKADESEDLIIKQLELADTLSGGDAVDTVRLFDGANEIKAEPYDLNGNKVVFKNLNIVVPADGEKTLDVLVDTNPITSTITSGTTLILELVNGIVRGESSGNDILGPFTLNTPSEFAIYNTLPVLTRTATPVGSGGPNNDMLEFTFAVQGDSGKKGTLEGMTVSFTGSCNTKPTEFSLYDGSSLIGDSGANLVLIGTEFTNGQGIAVDAGSSKTLTIKASTMGCAVNETLVVTVDEFIFNDGKGQHPANVSSTPPYENFTTTPFPLTGYQYKND